ncbi:glycosyltransferase [Bifidobacterium vansinderenii]|uniref:Glycosyl transferase n=1 Tax=Bifidobacterium vansinderenii TaxID=1984871 RepID=A0A229VZ60_9BIFI|nr:glycosyltransferase [Bifidobacterium vansinderenii]OXN00914.1 glycosyl transferase [Bifidobacterium vansinderenii]
MAYRQDDRPAADHEPDHESASSDTKNDPVGKAPERSEETASRRPLTIALVLDTFGNRGNGTSNSALQFAEELERQGHAVRLVGVGAPEYRARINRVPLVSWIAAKQQMLFAKPDDALFHRAFDGVDVVHIYMPFRFGRRALAVARQMGIPVTAGYHIQPENILYSAGPLKLIPGMPAFIYRLFRHWLYGKVDHIHVPTDMTARLLQEHEYRARLHVISNGYAPRFTGKNDYPATVRPPFVVIASGRLSHEKDQMTLIRALAACRHRDDVRLVIAGTGPLRRYLRLRARHMLARPADIGFHDNATMPDLLRSADLFVHPSIADLESVSVIEAMACGLPPVIARSDLSAAQQFALTDESLFPVRDVQALADRIDWWYEHPDECEEWGRRYAQHTREHYSVRSSVERFVAMEREAIADDRRARRSDDDGR